MVKDPNKIGLSFRHKQIQCTPPGTMHVKTAKWIPHSLAALMLKMRPRQQSWGLLGSCYRCRSCRCRKHFCTDANSRIIKCVNDVLLIKLIVWVSSEHFVCTLVARSSGDFFLSECVMILKMEFTVQSWEVPFLWGSLIFNGFPEWEMEEIM